MRATDSQLVQENNLPSYSIPATRNGGLVVLDRNNKKIVTHMISSQLPDWKEIETSGKFTSSDAKFNMTKLCHEKAENQGKDKKLKVR